MCQTTSAPDSTISQATTSICILRNPRTIHLHELLPVTTKTLWRLSYRLHCESYPPDWSTRRNGGKSFQPPLTNYNCSVRKGILVTESLPVPACGIWKPEARSLHTVSNMNHYYSEAIITFLPPPPLSFPFNVQIISESLDYINIK